MKRAWLWTFEKSFLHSSICISINCKTALAIFCNFSLQFSFSLFYVTLWSVRDADATYVQKEAGWLPFYSLFLSWLLLTVFLPWNDLNETIFKLSAYYHMLLFHKMAIDFIRHSWQYPLRASAVCRKARFPLIHACSKMWIHLLFICIQKFLKSSVIFLYEKQMDLCLRKLWFLTGYMSHLSLYLGGRCVSQASMSMRDQPTNLWMSTHNSTIITPSRSFSIFIYIL